MRPLLLRSRAPFLAVTCAVFTLWMWLGFGGARATTWVDDLGTLAAALFAGVMCALAARKCSGRARIGWWCLAVAAFSWAAGDAVWCWYELGPVGEVPFPSLADVGYLLAAPVGVVGVLFLSAGAARVSRARAVLDGLIIATSVFFVSWATALGATYAAGGTALEKVVGLAYPLMDLVWVVVVIGALSRTRLNRGTMAVIGAGLVAIAIADSAFTYLTQVGTYGSMNVLDAGWFIGFVLLGYAALRPWKAEADDVPKRISTAQVLLPYFPLTAVAAILVARNANRFSDALVVTGVILLVLVLLRQVVTVTENARLARRLEASVAELRDSEQQLRHQAFHDGLTNLANRSLLYDRLEHALIRQRRQQSPVGVLFCDLDDFKSVNDTLGHNAGDDLLVAVAERLRACVRPGDTVARIGGDEFAILLDVGALTAAVEIANRVLDALRSPFSLSDKHVFVHTSIGVVVSEGASILPVDELIRRADVALYAAKAGGRDCYAIFHEDMLSSAVAHIELREELRRAADDPARQFTIAYQPIIELESSAVAGVEALVRWQHPERGTLAPAEFLGLAEETGDIVAIGAYVLRAACVQAASWRALSPDLHVAVNISGRQLQKSDVVAMVRDALDRSGLPAGALILEITESLALVPDAEARITELAGLGVGLAIDDFGSGYSSLDYVRRLPVTHLKLDRSFVAEIHTSAGAEILANAIIRLAHDFGLATIAEGVENTQQLDALTRLGCQYAQGYLIDRPTDVEAISALLAAAPVIRR